MTFQIDEMRFSKGWFGFRSPDGDKAVRFIATAEPGLYDIIPHEEKRSLTANSYMWVLCDKLAEKTYTTKEDIYREAIRNVGLWKDFHLAPDEAKTFVRAWEMLGTGWITEQLDYARDGNSLVIRAYYGSSKYNSRQMARLIDHLVEECKEQDIETMPPDKLNSLLEAWDA